MTMTSIQEVHSRNKHEIEGLIKKYTERRNWEVVHALFLDLGKLLTLEDGEMNDS